MHHGCPIDVRRLLMPTHFQFPRSGAYVCEVVVSLPTREEVVK